MIMDKGDIQMRQKVAELSKIGYQHVHNNNFDSAIVAYEEAYKNAGGLDERTKAICALNLGAAFVARGREKEEEKEKSDDFQKGLTVLRSHYVESEACQSCAADTYFNIAFAYENLKDLQAALKFYDKARKKAFKFGNVDMEMECLQKSIQICSEVRDFKGASEHYKALAVIYTRQGNSLGQAECLCEAATILMKGDLKERAVATANDSFNVLNDLSVEGHQCILTAKILNDLGLVFIQLVRFNEGTQCFENALERFRQSQTENFQLEAVVLQNLGAAYNFEGDYQRSIHFHEKAIEKYGKIRYRSGQGQCFMNLAFALSQLGVSEIRNAEIAFQHALQASKDTGDHHMRWQTHEGLGAVTCNQGNYTAAKHHFQEALKFVGNNSQASNRIVKKLEMMITMEMKAMPTVGAKMVVNTATKMADHADLTTSTLQTVQEEMIVPATSQPPMMSQYSMTARKAQVQEKRILPLRRHDSVGMYHVQKVSRGLATPLSTRASAEFMSPRFYGNSSMGLEAPANVNESSEEESEATEESASRKEEEESTEEESEDSDASNRVTEKKIQQVFKGGYGTPSPQRRGPNTMGGTMGQTQDGNINRYMERLREKEEEEEVTEVEEESESEEDSDDDDDDEDESETVEESDDTEYATVQRPVGKQDQSQNGDQTTPKQTLDDYGFNTVPKQIAETKIDQKLAPPIPTQSPPSTANVGTADLATYINAEEKPSSPRSAPSPEIPKSPGQQNEQLDDTNPYATIGSIDTQHDNEPDSDKDDKNVPYSSLKQPRDDSGERSIDSLPRGQRDRLLAKEHQRAREQRESDSSDSPDDQVKKEEKSKICVVM